MVGKTRNEFDAGAVGQPRAKWSSPQQQQASASHISFDVRKRVAQQCLDAGQPLRHGPRQATAKQRKEFGTLEGVVRSISALE